MIDGKWSHIGRSRVYVLYQGINSQQLGYTSASSLGSGGNWTAPGGWPNASVTASPSAVAFTNASGQAYLYAFFPTSAGDLACVSMDTSSNMSSSTSLSAQGTNSACSTTSLVFSAVFDGSMYVFYQQSSGGLWYTCSPDGSTWSVPVQVGSTRLSGFPAAVTIGSQIYCFMNNANNLAFTCLTPGSTALGSSGNGMLSVPNMGNINEALGMSQSPAAIYYNDTLFCFYLDGNNMYVVSGTPADGWNKNILIANQDVATSSSPGPVAFNGSIYCFYQLSSHNELWYVVSSDNGSSWGYGIQVSNVGLWCGPSAVAYNDTLYVFTWRARTTAMCGYPQWTRPELGHRTQISAARYSRVARRSTPPRATRRAHLCSTIKFNLPWWDQATIAIRSWYFPIPTRMVPWGVQTSGRNR
jgi:hypothetical protein